MAEDYDQLADRLSMTELIRLQDSLSKSLVRRFEKRMALAFADVVGSTQYFARFGDLAGRKLQQRHIDFAQQSISEHQGRIVDTAGDGAFMAFANIEGALSAMVELQKRISVDNDSRLADERLTIRIGCHLGPVLTDGVQVAGDSVNFCSRVSSSANGGEIRVSREGYLALTDIRLRLKCRRLPPVELKGITGLIELLSLDWHDPTLFPTAIRFDDGTEITLPAQETIRFGRLRDQDGLPANDIVLTVSDPTSTNRVSRWHFELQRRSTGFLLRCVSDALTEVDGQRVNKGVDVQVRPGTRVRVGGVLTLEFVGNPLFNAGDSTMMS